MTNGRSLFELFELAVQMDRGERDRWLTELEQSDPDTAKELRALLAQDESGGVLPTAMTSAPLDTVRNSALEAARFGGEGLEAELEIISTYSVDAGRYELFEEIGRGAMGRVHRARDRLLGRDLAMKTIIASGSDKEGVSSEMLARFLREARVTGQLEHPAIVSVYDVGRNEEGDVYYTMPLVDGEDLAEVLVKTHGGSAEWSVSRILGVLSRVCEAMAYAHSRTVIHRDLKPSNVMVGRFGEVFVMDWGIARVQGIPEPAFDDQAEQGADPTSPLKTMEGSVIGTPAFMPPEQAMGDVDRVDERSDVYAVGAMLYQVLSGHRPYAEKAGSSPVSFLEHLITEPPKPIHELNPHAPVELIAVCEKAMARSPDDRYPDMADLGADLRAFLEDRVVAAYRTGPWVELRKWVRRNRSTAAALLGIVVLTVGAGGTVAWIERANAKTERSLTEKAEGEALRAGREADRATEEADRADRVRRGTERALEIMVEMFEHANPNVAKGEVISARDVLDQGAERIDQLDEEVWITALLMDAMGHSYIGLSEFQQAVSLLQEGWELRREELGADDIETLSTLAALAQARSNLGQIDVALEHYATCIEGFRALGDNAQNELLRVQNSLGASLTRLGRHREAQQVLEGALEERIAFSHPDDTEVILLRSNLASAYMATYDLEKVQSHIRAALTSLHRTEGPRHPWSVGMKTTLASLLLQKNETFDEGLRLLEEAVATADEVLDPGHVQRIEALRVFAVALSRRGNDDAEPRIRQAVQEANETLGPSSQATLLVEVALGAVLLAKGDREEAFRVFEAVLPRARTTLSIRSSVTIEANQYLAKEWDRRREPVRAMPHWKEAWLGDAPPEGSLVLRSLLSLEGYVNCLLAIGGDEELDEALWLLEELAEYVEELAPAEGSTQPTKGTGPAAVVEKLLDRVYDARAEGG